MLFSKAYVRDIVKSSALLDAFTLIGFWGTINQVMKRFPLLSPVVWLLLPPALIRSFPTIIRVNHDAVKVRVSHRGEIKHPDYFQHFCPDDGTPTPPDSWLESNANELLVAGFDPVTNFFYATVYFLLKEPATLRLLEREIRGSFSAYDQITVDALPSLKYLQAVLQESLRLHTNGAFGLPRRSPGAVVDGRYIPKGYVPHRLLSASLFLYYS